MEWLNNGTIKIDPPSRPKKITGTRFGAILGQNVWKTAFEMWCEITHTYEPPFEESIYTLAGKVIEDRQCKYLKKAYFLDKVVKPEDVYGADFFKRTHGDFYPQEKVFGGMWDALVEDKDGTPIAVVECKTTKRAEDWVDKDGNITIPEYYALQGALYAKLLGLDDVYMIVSVLDEATYNQAQKVLDDLGVASPKDIADDNEYFSKAITYNPNSKNTNVIYFKVSEKYPDFNKLMRQATLWYNSKVLKGISPKYDEQKDATALKELRKNYVNPTTDLDELLHEYEELDNALTDYYSLVKDKEDRKSNLKGQITELLKAEFRDGDKQVVVDTPTSSFTLTKAERKVVDSKKLAEDGLLDQYQTTSESFTLKRNAIKEVN